jgi:hypothetical protein
MSLQEQVLDRVFNKHKPILFRMMGKAQAHMGNGDTEQQLLVNQSIEEMLEAMDEEVQAQLDAKTVQMATISDEFARAGSSRPRLYSLVTPKKGNGNDQGKGGSTG